MCAAAILDQGLKRTIQVPSVFPLSLVTVNVPIGFFVEGGLKGGMGGRWWGGGGVWRR